MTAIELLPSPPHIVGPTWQKTVDGDWHLPEDTLGWGILNWWANYVKSPGGEHAGSPFMPTLEQARFVLWWYAVTGTGRHMQDRRSRKPCHSGSVLHVCSSFQACW